MMAPAWSVARLSLSVALPEGDGIATGVVLGFNGPGLQACSTTGLRAALGVRLEAVGREDSGERSGSTTKTNYEQERAEAAEFVPLPNSATSAVP